MQGDQMPDCINIFHNSYSQQIGEKLDQHNAHEYEVQIISILYFLDQFQELMAQGVSKSQKNSNEYFDDVIGKYIASRNKIYKLSLQKKRKIGETIPDQMVKLILLEYEKQDKETVKKYIDGHILAMSAENLLGSLLEAYIAENTEDYGWIWCCGEIVFATDFIKFNSEGNWVCLQVKNADNSLNSSGSKIRDIFKDKIKQNTGKAELQIWCRSISKWQSPL